MHGAALGRGAFDAHVVAQVGAGQVVAEVAARAAEFGACFDVTVAADGDADAAAVVDHFTLTLDVYDRGVVQSVLGGQCAGEDAEVVGEAGFQRLAEAADGLRNDHTVDAVLNVGVIAADVKLAVRVLNDSRRLENHLVQRRAVTQRQALDVAAVEPIDGTAGVG